ncbi:neogenin-like isoform X2 [Amphiura filiformis]|uniref:neogenin-like isoform X2 n=1 Tax=Amphiura filiformis TaxID=82378 RepID=UPI003B215203
MAQLLAYSLLIFVVLGYNAAQGAVPPPQFTLESNAPDSFVIRFDRTGIPGTVTTWRVQYRAAGATKKNLNIAGGHDEHIIDGLTADTPFKVRVMANTDRGKGKYSAWTGVRTASEAVVAPEPVAATIPESPQNLAVDVRGTTASLSWSPPADNGAEVIGYVVSYGPADNARENVFTLRPDPTRTDLEGLNTNVQYMVTITAYNTNGQSYPATFEFSTSRVRGPPPQPENIRYESINPTTLRITWSLPDTMSSDEIENIRFGFGDVGTRVEYLSSSNLGKDATSYTAEGLQPGTQYTVMVITENRYGQSDPVTLTVETSAAPPPPVTDPDTSPPDQDVVPPPQQLQVDVISPTSVRISFVDPTISQVQEVTNDRYYTLRYKRQSDPGYEYANIRENTYTLEYLQPETNYQFEVMVVLGRDLQSEYTTVYVFTSDPSRQDMVRGVTAIQVKVTSPGVLSAVINWLPPQNQQTQIRGYVLEIAAGENLTPSTTWESMETDDRVPSMVVSPLTANTTYHVRVAPRVGNQIGDFSNPPEVFLTPTVPPSGQPLHMCSSSETTEEVIERVNWMRDGGGDIARPALVGVPLPYCDDYYGIHECHGLVCFCIPGKRPQSDAACRSGGYQGDQPIPDGPCQAEYEAGRQAITEARTAGKTLTGVHLPLCSDDGYYQPKQCLGSVCYCSTRRGEHTGKEVPVWQANSLQC